MLKKILIGSIAAATMTASAYAADLPVRQPPPPPPVPVCTWCGFYVGLNGGGAFTPLAQPPLCGNLRWQVLLCKRLWAASFAWWWIFRWPSRYQLAVGHVRCWR